MLIHPWDAATGPAGWQDRLVSAGRFGILAAGNLAQAPRDGGSGASGGRLAHGCARSEGEPAGAMLVVCAAAAGQVTFLSESFQVGSVFSTG